jgi:hypothetical protein
MNCYYCKGVNTIEEQAVRLCECEAALPYIVENVPTFVCRLCGDKSYSGETLTILEKITKGEALAASFQVIQVFDFQRLDGEPERLASHSFPQAMDSEFQYVPPMIFYEKSAQWRPAVLQQFGWHLPDDQQRIGYVDFRPREASQRHRFSDFSNVANIEHIDYYSFTPNSQVEVSRLGYGVKYGTISTGYRA